MAEHTSHDAPPGTQRRPTVPAGTGSGGDSTADLDGRPARNRRWSVLVPVIAALAGLLVTTTVRRSAGTTLRDDRRPELTRLIGQRRAQVADKTRRAAAGLTAVHGPGVARSATRLTRSTCATPSRTGTTFSRPRSSGRWRWTTRRRPDRFAER